MQSPDERWLSCLWYAWGRKDSGQYEDKTPLLDVFEFAKQQKKAQDSFDKEETMHLDSVQGAWDKYVAEKMTDPAVEAAATLSQSALLEAAENGQELGESDED